MKFVSTAQRTGNSMRCKTEEERGEIHVLCR